MKHFLPKEDPILRRSSARILCFDVFWLVLTYFQHGIKLEVEHEHETAQLVATSSDKQGSDELQEACHDILLFAEEQLHELKGNALKPSRGKYH